LIYYRGYILLRLKIIGKQWEIVNKLRKLSPEEDDNWKITYTAPIYGGWDLIIECAFKNLEELDKIVSFCRFDDELSSWIDATTTLISTKQTFKIS
jgi:hypothetical protein